MQAKPIVKRWLWFLRMHGMGAHLGSFDIACICSGTRKAFFVLRCSPYNCSSSLQSKTIQQIRQFEIKIGKWSGQRQKSLRWYQSSSAWPASLSLNTFVGHTIIKQDQAIELHRTTEPPYLAQGVVGGYLFRFSFVLQINGCLQIANGLVMKDFMNRWPITPLQKGTIIEWVLFIYQLGNRF